MADATDAAPDREDPVLVRPYIKAASGGVAEQERGPDETDEVWPETASLPDEPAPDEADTVVQPAVPAAAPRAYGLGLGPRLLILCGGVVLALALVGYFLFRPDEPAARQPSTALPAFSAAPADPATTVGPSPSASAGTSTSASPSGSPSASTSVSPSLSPSVTPPPSSAPASPATPAPPATARTGAITAASGRCLALGGLLGINGSPVQVSGCMGVSAQRFTLATDGTLQVNGRCAQATGDASIRVNACDEQAAGQWRAGANGTLVNSASGQCLTDPGWVGANATVTTCSGAAEQTWTLP